MAAGDLLTRLRGVVYAVLAALLLVAIDQVRTGAPGPWIEVGASALAALCFLTAGLFIATALRRRRDGLTRRAYGWGVGAAWALLAAALALEVVVQAVQLRSTLSGADVHLTAPCCAPCRARRAPPWSTRDPAPRAPRASPTTCTSPIWPASPPSTEVPCRAPAGSRTAPAPSWTCSASTAGSSRSRSCSTSPGPPRPTSPATTRSRSTRPRQRWGRRVRKAHVFEYGL